MAAIERAAHEPSLQRPALLQILVQKGLDLSRRQYPFIDESFEAKGVRCAADRDRRVGQLQQAQKCDFAQGYQVYFRSLNSRNAVSKSPPSVRFRIASYAVRRISLDVP